MNPFLEKEFPLRLNKSLKKTPQQPIFKKKEDEKILPSM